MMNHFGEIRNELDFSKQESSIDTIVEPNEDPAMRRTLALRFVLFLIRTAVADADPPLRNRFCANNGLRGLMNMLGDPAFVDANLATELIMSGDARRPFLDFTVRAVTELSSYCDEVMQYWREVNTVSILRSLWVKIPDSAYRCLTAITNLADDAQIEKLDEVNTFRGMLIDRLQDISSQFGVLVKTSWFTIYENRARIYTCAVKYDEPNGGETSIFDILQSLYKLAINDKMKSELYFYLDCKKYVKSILFNLDAVPLYGSEEKYEQKYTFR
jgi:hypothetical protein